MRAVIAQIKLNKEKNRRITVGNERVLMNISHVFLAICMRRVFFGFRVEKAALACSYVKISVHKSRLDRVSFDANWLYSDKKR